MIDNFEIGQFLADFAEVDESVFEISTLLEDIVEWNTVFTDEIPIITYAVADESLDELYEFVLVDSDDMPYTLDYALASNSFLTEEFEWLKAYYFGRISLFDEDDIYTFASFTWNIKDIDEFPIVFPPYNLWASENFDFSDTPFRYATVFDEFSFQLPTIYFVNTFVETFGDTTWKQSTTDEFYSTTANYYRVDYDETIDNLIPLPAPANAYNDAFTGANNSSPNPDLWIVNKATGSISIQNNSLYLTNTVNNTYVYVISKYSLYGAFDIQVDFSGLTTGYGGGGCGLELKVQTPDGIYQMFSKAMWDNSARWQGAWSNNSASTWNGPVTSRTNNFGKLRLVRAPNLTTLTAYRADGNGSWVQLLTCTTFSNNPTLYVLLGDWNTAGTTTSYVDNFTINSGTIASYSLLEQFRRRFSSAATTDEFPSLITTWNRVDSYDVEPNPVAVWIPYTLEDFLIFPPIYALVYPAISYLESFDCDFTLFTTEGFDMPANYITAYIETFDFIPFNRLRFQEDFEAKGKIGIYVGEASWRRVLPIGNFRFDRVVDPFIDWKQLEFKEWFDFDDFDCTRYIKSTSKSSGEYGGTLFGGGFEVAISNKFVQPCPAKIVEEFDISSELAIPFTLSATDTFEFSDYTHALVFDLYTIDDMFDFPWHTYNKDSFEFNDHPLNPVPADVTTFLEYPKMYWGFYDPDIENFASPVHTYYLEHITEYYSFDNSISYRLLIEDGFDYTLFNAFDEVTFTYELPVRLNKKLIGYDYIDNGFMKGYLYLDYEIQPPLTMKQRTKVLDTLAYRIYDTEEFEIFDIYDSMMTMDYVPRMLRLNLGMNPPPDTLIVTDTAYYTLHKK